MNNEMITANGCNYIDDFLEHKNGFKYKDKYIGPSGKWVYVYTDPMEIETGTDIITGKQSREEHPETKHYAKLSDRLLSRTYTLNDPNDSKKRVAYHEIGKLEQGSQAAGNVIRKSASEAGREVSKVAKKAGTAAYDVANRASGGRVQAKVYRAKRTVQDVKDTYKTAKKAYKWYKKNKKYIDAGAKFISGKY